MYVIYKLKFIINVHYFTKYKKDIESESYINIVPIN